MVVASFHLLRFRRALGPTARVPLDRRGLRHVPGLRFGKVLGTGRGRTMTASADLRRWAVFAVFEDEGAAERFRTVTVPERWPTSTERFDVLMRPLGARGSWDGTDPTEGAHEPPTTGAPVAVLTRATVRWRSLPAFLRAVPPVDAHLHGADGLLATVGVGELPVGRQATFSLWRDLDAMRRFAHRSAEHAEVVRRTRVEGWYGEELFARFEPIRAWGTWDGRQPLSDRRPWAS